MKSFFKKVLTVTVVCTVILLILLLIVFWIFAIYVNQTMEKSIDESLFTMVASDSETAMYYYEKDENGTPKAIRLTDEVLYGGYRCSYVSYDRIPENLVNAFVSIEDKRFYTHHGVDWKRTVSAGTNYFLKFSDSFGGSTITQQLIKNVTDEDDYSFQRKIQEIFWALDLETKMDKQEILELYLNIINLSQGCYGVQAAADYYFSKDVSELTLNECVCIAAITNSPTYYDPIRNPSHNETRKNIILNEMYQQGYISYEEMMNCTNQSVTLNINEKYDARGINSWYVDMVIEDVIQDLMEEKGYSRAMANLMIYTGGLQIYTAMDPNIQSILEEYYANSSHFFASTDGETPQSAMMVLDPSNGDILGVVGAIGAKNANRVQNFATQTVRPAGSVIKPLSVYAPALDERLITWSSVYDDVPVNFGAYNLDPSKGNLVAPVAWPKNSNGVYRGLTNINYALQQSINTVTVRVLEDFGVEKSFDFLYNRLHMKNLIRASQDAEGNGITDMDIAALALGQMNYGLTVREVSAAYSIFVNRGIYNHPRSYYKVADQNGSILLSNPYQGEAVIEETTAAVMNKMLENVVTNGTAKTIQLKNSIHCAGKTGTTQSNYDRWFVGYTPYLIGGVWYGYEYPKSLSGSNQCLSIWDNVMTQIHERCGYLSNQNPKTFDEGTDMITCEYCVDSGLLMTQACQKDPRGNRSEIGYFIKGTEPTEYCTCHVPVLYDTKSGGVAIEGICPDTSTEYVGLIHVERSFPIQITVTDAQYVWRDIGTEVMPETAVSLPFFNRMLGEGEYCGISAAELQYNRLCRSHFQYVTWKDTRQKENE